MCPRNFGGIRSVVLYRLRDVTFEHSPSVGGFTRCVLAPSATPLEVHFADSGARYKEHIGPEGGVEHRLEMVVGGLSVELLGRVGAMSRGGIVALVALCSGGSLVVGYSPQGGGDYPLRLLEAEADSATKRTERPTVRLVLGCEDGWSATPLACD